MRAAVQLGKRVSKLILIEPNPFALLRDNGRQEAFDEIGLLRDVIKMHGARGEWAVAAEHFADYWGGRGTWESMSLDRRVTFAEALKPNFHEWDAVMNDATSLHDSGQIPSSRYISNLRPQHCPAHQGNSSVDERGDRLEHSNTIAGWSHGSLNSARYHQRNDLGHTAAPIFALVICRS